MTTLDTGLLDTLQHQVAVFARRAEQTRLGGVGQVRNSMDRAAYLLLNRLDQEGPMGVKALAARHGHRLVDRDPAGRPAGRHRPGQAHLAPRGRPRRRAPAVPARQARLEEVRSSRRELMAQVTDDWTAEERESFCTLLTRFNIALSARMAAAVPQAGGATGVLTPAARLLTRAPPAWPCPSTGPSDRTAGPHPGSRSERRMRQRQAPEPPGPGVRGIRRGRRRQAAARRHTAHGGAAGATTRSRAGAC